MLRVNLKNIWAASRGSNQILTLQKRVLLRGVHVGLEPRFIFARKQFRFERMKNCETCSSPRVGGLGNCQQNYKLDIRRELIRTSCCSFVPHYLEPRDTSRGIQATGYKPGGSWLESWFSCALSFCLNQLSVVPSCLNKNGREIRNLFVSFPPTLCQSIDRFLPKGTSVTWQDTLQAIFFTYLEWPRSRYHWRALGYPKT